MKYLLNLNILLPIGMAIALPTNVFAGGSAVHSHDDTKVSKKRKGDTESKSKTKNDSSREDHDARKIRDMIQVLKNSKDPSQVIGYAQEISAEVSKFKEKYGAEKGSILGKELKSEFEKVLDSVTKNDSDSQNQDSEQKEVGELIQLVEHCEADNIRELKERKSALETLFAVKKHYTNSDYKKWLSKIDVNHMAIIRDEIHGLQGSEIEQVYKEVNEIKDRKVQNGGFSVDDKEEIASIYLDLAKRMLETAAAGFSTFSRAQEILEKAKLLTRNPGTLTEIIHLTNGVRAENLRNLAKNGRLSDKFNENFGIEKDFAARKVSQKCQTNRLGSFAQERDCYEAQQEANFLHRTAPVAIQMGQHERSAMLGSPFNQNLLFAQMYQAQLGIQTPFGFSSPFNHLNPQFPFLPATHPFGFPQPFGPSHPFQSPYGFMQRFPDGSFHPSGIFSPGILSHYYPGYTPYQYFGHPYFHGTHSGSPLLPHYTQGGHFPIGQVTPVPAAQFGDPYGAYNIHFRK